MRRASLIQRETQQISTVRDLTAVFESLASMQVAKIKDKVKMSEDFFNLLWQRYSLIRVDPGSRITERAAEKNQRGVFVIVSAEAGLSGDIDERLIETMLGEYDATTTDVMVLGSHGANQLRDRDIAFSRFFKVPESESYIDVSPVIDAIASYSKIKAFYEEYVSLGVQEIRSIDLYSSLQDMSAASDTKNDELITDKDTIFEPSLDEIADIMEKGMLALAFSQVILESSLAQAASRFNAMAQAKKRAFELIAFQNLEFHRAKRSESDRRLREVLIGIKKKKLKTSGAASGSR